MLHSPGARPGLAELHGLAATVSEGPGVRRAGRPAAGPGGGSGGGGGTGGGLGTRGSASPAAPAPVEWSLETDPVVRFHLECALSSYDALMLRELRLEA